MSGDVSIPDVTNPILPLTLTGDAHLIAHFGLPVPPEELTFNVVPSGAGDILLDGTAFSSYPTTEMIDVGSHNLQAEPVPWWLFSHWSLDGNVLGPTR